MTSRKVSRDAAPTIEITQRAVNVRVEKGQETPQDVNSGYLWVAILFSPVFFWMSSFLQ